MKFYREMPNQNKYTFGFTAASLRLNDFVKVAKIRLEGVTIDHVNMLGGGKTATGKRMLSEYDKRLSTLTKDQLNILVDGILTSQKQIAFLSVCKTNAFIRDFTVEVIREKFMLFDYNLSDGDYLSFFRRKFDLHPELEKITDKTTYKIKQVTFKILEEAGIIDSIKTRIIQPQLIEKSVMEAIAKDNKEWLKVLLVSDYDIKNIN